MDREIMTVKELADYFQIDEHSVYRMARKGAIPAFKIGSQWRFKKSEIDKWIQSKHFETKNFEEASNL
ncbi:MAG: helix-turn-helix domain-containing protein [Ignavibacteriales bacterium]